MSDVFVSMSFSNEFQTVFQTIEKAVKKVGLNVYRVDQEVRATLIVEDIKRKIRESRIFIADLTGNNPNVLNEIGQAQTLGKPIILFSQDKPEDSPFNVRGLHINQYDPKKLDYLYNTLKKTLSEATSPNEILRAMLVPSSLGQPAKDSRFVIAASPLSFRRAMKKIGGYKELRRTSSDYVGVRGILQAFGLLYGFDALPDNLDPDDFDDSVIEKPMNLYCISSPKANRWTGKLLKQNQEDCWIPKLEFKADDSSENLQNVRVSIYKDDHLLHPDGWVVNSGGDRYYRDFGLIVRGPNPYHKNFMFSIIAGRSSLGTEAASIVFTDPEKIKIILQRLRGLEIDIENHEEAFYVLVSMKLNRGDGREEANMDTLRVEKVDALRQPAYHTCRRP